MAPTTMGTPVEELVDLDRYPVLDTGGSRPSGTWSAAARTQLVATGAVELPGFLNATGIAALVADADGLAPRAHHSSGEGTAYLEFPDFSLPDDHPRLTWGHYAVGAVRLRPDAGDSLLRQVYEWEPLRNLVEAVLDRGPVYRYADPFGALNLAVMHEGDELQWHFDQTDFVVSLAIQTADHGGYFEVFPADPHRRRRALRRCGRRPGRRPGGSGDPADGAGHVAGVRRPVLAAPGEPGRGTGLVRHVGLLAYDTQPGTMGSELLARPATAAPSRIADLGTADTWPVP